MDLNYNNEHREKLTNALRGLGLMDSQEAPPEPYGKLSGVAGKSVVYLIALPGKAGDRFLVCKFDQRERAAAEWEVIDRLRQNTAEIATAVLLPIEDNVESDGVILYEGAAGRFRSGMVKPLGQYLEDNFADAFENCRRALATTLLRLEPFYHQHPGQAVPAIGGRAVTWQDLFSKLGGSESNLIEVVPTHWRGADEGDEVVWLSDAEFRLEGRLLPNPIHALAARLGMATGTIMRSRVHGDLNLTNVLIGLSPTHEPDDAAIIDLGMVKDDWVTAADFARIESELWHEVFPHVFPDIKPARRLKIVMSIQDCLSGRHKGLRGPAIRRQRKWIGLIAEVRTWAQKVLQTDVSQNVLGDYFHCLYFSDLWSLAFYNTVRLNGANRELALVNGALALRTLEDIEKGRYGRNAEPKPLQLRHTEQPPSGRAWFPVSWSPLTIKVSVTFLSMVVVAFLLFLLFPSRKTLGPISRPDHSPITASSCGNLPASVCKDLKPLLAELSRLLSQPIPRREWDEAWRQVKCNTKAGINSHLSGVYKRLFEGDAGAAQADLVVQQQNAAGIELMAFVNRPGNETIHVGIRVDRGTQGYCVYAVFLEN